MSRLRTARNEGYLAGNRDSCRQQAAEIHPLMGRKHCAVFPWATEVKRAMIRFTAGMIANQAAAGFGPALAKTQIDSSNR